MVRSEQYGYDIELLKQGRLKQGKPVAAQKPQPKPAPSKKDNAVKKNQKWVDKNKKEKPGTGKGKGGR